MRSLGTRVFIRHRALLSQAFQHWFSALLAGFSTACVADVAGFSALLAGCAAMQQENAQTLREVTLCASCNHGVEETCALTKATMFCQFSVKSLWVARLLGAQAVKLVSG